MTELLFHRLRYGHLDTARRLGVFQLARYCGRFLPLPAWLRLRARRLLAGWQFARGGWPDEHVIHAPKVLPDIRRSPARHSCTAEVRPALCGLEPGLVSVVLPVYNQASLLDASIRSVLAQTHAHFELIIIDDGSADDVATVLRPYLAHPRIRCYTQHNQKLPKALSNGFDLARGEFWTWTSADNLMAPDMLAMMVAKLVAQPRLGMVYADYLAIDDRGLPLADRHWRGHNRPDPESGAIRLPHTADALNAVHDNFIGPCFMYRGWIGRCIGDYDLRLGVEDYDYWMRINAYFELGHLGQDDLLYSYRVHDNSLSGQSAELGIPERSRALMAYEKERVQYHATAPAFVADARAMAWLQSFEGIPGQARLWSGRRLSGPADLLVISCATAAAEIERISRLRLPVVILFEAGSSHCEQLQPLLARPDCMALIACQQVAAQVRELAPCCPMIDAEADQAFTALYAFMKNRRLLSSVQGGHAGKRVRPALLTSPAP